MPKQFAVAYMDNDQELFVKSTDGRMVFSSLEEATLVASKSNIPNLKFYSRDVSPWAFEGDMVSSNIGKF